MSKLPSEGEGLEQYNKIHALVYSDHAPMMGNQDPKILAILALIASQSQAAEKRGYERGFIEGKLSVYDDGFMVGAIKPKYRKEFDDRHELLRALDSNNKDETDD